MSAPSIFHADYSREGAFKELLLLEKHILCAPCPDCMNKHLFTAIAYEEEAVTLAEGSMDDLARAEQLRALADDDLLDHFQDVRAVRKAIAQQLGRGSTAMIAGEGASAIDPSATSWLAIGDSLTVGEVGSAVGPPALVEATRDAGYRALAAQALLRVGVGPFKDPTGRHHGAIGGASTHTFLSEAPGVPFVNGPPDLTWMRLYRPDVVSIMLGTNDFLATPSEDPENVVSRIGILVTAANALYPDVQRYELYSIMETSDRTRAFNAAIAARVIAPGHFMDVQGRIFFVDASRKANVALRAGAPVTAAGHWNARGYADVAAAIVEGVRTGAVTDGEVPLTGAPAAPVPAPIPAGRLRPAFAAAGLGLLAALAAPRLVG